MMLTMRGIIIVIYMKINDCLMLEEILGWIVFKKREKWMLFYKILSETKELAYRHLDPIKYYILTLVRDRL